MSEPQLGDYFTSATIGTWRQVIPGWIIRWTTATKVPAKRSWRTLWRDHKWSYSKVNHTGIYVGNGKIIEAIGRVRIDPVSFHPNAIWSHFPLTDAQRHAIAQFSFDQVGKSYNWAGLVAVGLAQERFGRHLKGLARQWWVKKLENDGQWFCSQLTDASYAAGGVQLFNDERPNGLVSPQDLYDLPDGH